MYKVAAKIVFISIACCHLWLYRYIPCSSPLGSCRVYLFCYHNWYGKCVCLYSSSQVSKKFYGKSIAIWVQQFLNTVWAALLISYMGCCGDEKWLCSNRLQWVWNFSFLYKCLIRNLHKTNYEKFECKQRPLTCIRNCINTNCWWQ